MLAFSLPFIKHLLIEKIADWENREETTDEGPVSWMISRFKNWDDLLDWFLVVFSFLSSFFHSIGVSNIITLIVSPLRRHATIFSAIDRVLWRGKEQHIPVFLLEIRVHQVLRQLGIRRYPGINKSMTKYPYVLLERPWPSLKPASDRCKGVFRRLEDPSRLDLVLSRYLFCSWISGRSVERLTFQMFICCGKDHFGYLVFWMMFEPRDFGAGFKILSRSGDIWTIEDWSLVSLIWICVMIWYTREEHSQRREEGERNLFKILASHLTEAHYFSHIRARSSWRAVCSPYSYKYPALISWTGSSSSLWHGCQYVEKWMLQNPYNSKRPWQIETIQPSDRRIGFWYIEPTAFKSLSIINIPRTLLVQHLVDGPIKVGSTAERLQVSFPAGWLYHEVKSKVRSRIGCGWYKRVNQAREGLFWTSQ